MADNPVDVKALEQKLNGQSKEGLTANLFESGDIDLRTEVGNTFALTALDWFSVYFEQDKKKQLEALGYNVKELEKSGVNLETFNPSLGKFIAKFSTQYKRLAVSHKRKSRSEYVASILGQVQQVAKDGYSRLKGAFG